MTEQDISTFLAREKALNDALKAEANQVTEKLTQLEARSRTQSEELKQIEQAIPYLRGRLDAINATLKALTEDVK